MLQHFKRDPFTILAAVFLLAFLMWRAIFEPTPRITLIADIVLTSMACSYLAAAFTDAPRLFKMESIVFFLLSSVVICLLAATLFVLLDHSLPPLEPLLLYQLRAIPLGVLLVFFLVRRRLQRVE